MQHESDDMTRTIALDRATDYVRSGRFLADLGRRVAYRTESADPQPDELRRYLTDEIVPMLHPLGFSSDIVALDGPEKNLFLIATRDEDPALPTVLLYGHGDVVAGMDAEWAEGLQPWQVVPRGDRLYGRGTADNKGQHTIVLAALAEVLAARGGRLGFNTKLLIEMGEETGSPGLDAIALARRDCLAADVLIASDGPRLDAKRPTLFLGARGILQLRLSVDCRTGGNHSGNWGGLLANPAIILAHAIATMVDARGRILVDGLRPPQLSNAIRHALGAIEITPGPDDPQIDADWGEPGLTPAERVYGWNSLDVLAISAGDIARPVSVARPINAIPGRADAILQLRFVVGTDVATAGEAVAAHLADHGLSGVQVEASVRSNATRLDLDDPWVRWATKSIAATTSADPAVLPNLGGSLPNDVFADTLGLKTLWVPHSYPGCSQHAPNEHLLASVAEEGVRIMAGLFWDLGEPDGPTTFQRNTSAQR